jgi:hypothetical protein
MVMVLLALDAITAGHVLATELAEARFYPATSAPPPSGNRHLRD